MKQLEIARKNGGTIAIMKADFFSHIFGLAKPARTVQILRSSGKYHCEAHGFSDPYIVNLLNAANWKSLAENPK